MNSTFPFGFPGPTAFYLTAYVLTLVLHVVFMNYVLGGAAFLFVRSMRRLSGKKEPDALFDLLKDWLPFALSAAITAGIAPLLFVQILYKKGFYTANLLLFHRWMAILPALIVAFYLLYALKTAFVAAKPWLFAACAGGALLLFLFTALSWTENYLLGRNEGAWANMYASRAMVYRNNEILPRMLLWSVGALPTLAALLGWQLLRRERAGGAMETRDPRRVASIGIFGLVAAGACAAGYAFLIGPSGRASATGPLGLPWLVLAALGAVTQGAAWIVYLRSSSGRGKPLGIVTTGLLATIVGTTCVREVLRITVVDFPALYPEHAQAAAMGGRYLFLVFFALNATLAAWAIRASLTRAAGASGGSVGAQTIDSSKTP